MSTSLPPPVSADVLTSGSEGETAAAIAALRQSAREDGDKDARTHGPDAVDGHVQARADLTPAHEAAARQGVSIPQRQERGSAVNQLRQAAARVAELEGHERGQPVPPGVRVKPGAGLIVGGVIVGASLGAEGYVLKGPFDTLLSAGGGFSWPALGIAAVMIGAAALSSHFRASACQERDALPPGASRARDGLRARIFGLTLLLVAESVMAFTARAYDSSYGTGSYFNATTLSYGMFQLVFFLLAMTLPGVLLRLHDVAKEAAVRHSLTEAKAHQSAATAVVADVQQTHDDQLERMSAARREITIAYLDSLAAATYEVPKMGDRIRGLMPLVRADGTLPPVTRTEAPQETPRQTRPADVPPDDAPPADDPPDDDLPGLGPDGPGDAGGDDAPSPGYRTAEEMFDGILNAR
jgi:hypothetical protein